MPSESLDEELLEPKLTNKKNPQNKINPIALKVYEFDSEDIYVNSVIADETMIYK